MSGQWESRTLLVAGIGLLTAAVSGATQEPLSFERYRDEIEPIFLKARGGHGPGMSPCVTCHVHNGTPLKLAAPQEGENGDVFWTEEQSRKNFEVVKRLVVPGRPERSRLLLEPLSVAAGGARLHSGGKFFETRDDEEWQRMEAWVEDAAPSEEAREDPIELDFEFFQNCVQRIFMDKREGRMECVHCHNSRAPVFAPDVRDGGEFWSDAESRRNFTVLSEYIEPGFPLRSRFLTHPLAPEAGGDHFHGGGRRWPSQDDSEWQMLAAWVRGETPQCLGY